jgi:hypothetical protein
VEKNNREIYAITLQEIMDKFKITGSLRRFSITDKLDWDNKKNELVLEVSR